MEKMIKDMKEEKKMQLNEVSLGLGGGSLLQVANRSLTQMMSYIVDSPAGKVIVIDGGNYCEEDADHLYELIKNRGGHVDLWLITHAHSDHLGALLWIMEKYPVFDLQIDKLCFHFPKKEWLKEKEEWEYNDKFFSNIERHGINVEIPFAGDVFKCGGITVEIISHPEEYEYYPQINPTSMLFLVHFPKRDVLFLGDFDVNGQEEFLRKGDVSKIQKDIVQMAHHGQGGVDRTFYELIQPQICLYPTPKWLWENNKYMCLDSETVGTGPFATLETRRWMEELEVQASYTCAEGDYLFT